MNAEKLASLLLEMPDISKTGKTVYANELPLKDLPLASVKDNIAIFRHSEGNFMFPAGFTLAYFMQDEAATQAIKAGNYPYKVVPDRPRFAMNYSPITAVWKGKADKDQKAILGVVQGITNEKEIYVDKATVRPGYRQNSITSKLIDALKEMFPNAVVNFSGPTKQGAAFVKKYTGADWKPAHGEHAEI